MRFAPRHIFATATFLAACGGTEVPAHGEVPAQEAPLFDYLVEGNYEDFEAETEVHGSTGPHGQVRTFVDPLLAGSLADGATEHPVGAAAVKELHDAEGLRGWAVSVKVEEGTDADTWYWYEVFSTEDNSPVVSDRGASLCAGCHGGGTDYVLTPYPLQ